MRLSACLLVLVDASTAGASLHAGRAHIMTRHRLGVSRTPVVLSVAPEPKKNGLEDRLSARAAVRTSSVNLAKNIICGGFLSLPAGVAACARTPTALTLVPGSVLLLGMGALSACESGAPSTSVSPCASPPLCSVTQRSADRVSPPQTASGSSAARARSRGSPHTRARGGALWASAARAGSPCRSPPRRRPRASRTQ
jgi:hypothetical protein